MTYIVCPPNGIWHTQPGTPDEITLMDLVAGYLETVRLEAPHDAMDGALMWMNDDGKLLTLPINPIATRAALQFGRSGDDVIYGTVVFTGEADEEGEIVGLDQDWLPHLFFARSK